MMGLDRDPVVVDRHHRSAVKEYYIFLLVLQTGMLGAFMSLDFPLFFLFWEVMLVPMYFLIGIWGSAQPALLGDQVLPLHTGRQRRHAAGHPGAYFSQSHA